MMPAAQLTQPISHRGSAALACGAIVASGSPNVLINNLPAARACQDVVTCSDHPHSQIPLTQGSDTVSINFLPAARMGDACACGARICAGSPNVFIGSSTYQNDDALPGTASWLSLTVAAMGLNGENAPTGPAQAILAVAGAMLGNGGSAG